MANIYVVNKSCHDYSKAERFGNLIYLSEGAINRYATGNMYRAFWPILKDSDINDYLLPTGLTIMNIVAAGIFASIHGRVNLLVYKATRKAGKEEEYLERILVFD